MSILSCSNFSLFRCSFISCFAFLYSRASTFCFSFRSCEVLSVLFVWVCFDVFLLISAWDPFSLLLETSLEQCGSEYDWGSHVPMDWKSESYKIMRIYYIFLSEGWWRLLITACRDIFLIIAFVLV